MYTRTIYATGDPAKMDGAVEALRTEGPRLLSGQPGFLGLSVFVDRELGKLLVGSWWETEQARQASDDAIREERAALFKPYVTTFALDNWEAAVAVRPATLPQPGAGFRMGRLEFDPSDADLLVETFRSTALPRFQAIPGFLGSSLFIDRAKGRATVGVVYTDRNTLAASRAAQSQARGEAIAKARFTLRSLEEFDVAFMTSG
ncbi:antibiotic biosynthesis monooxygenase [Kitasatospora azatica]|uniref:antibiotic biosynthesis monooxygenase n=1 Tax=Kitasatospora azatica TaxID=58347 RepID=UPI00056C659B|nr:antibiotic biosynthesis monooxygenase [Kitasatospora azatica]